MSHATDPTAEPDAGRDAGQDAGQAALLAEAATKSGLVWLRPDIDGDTRSWPAWHVWHEGAVLVVRGPGEQELPTLSGPVEIVLRSKDSGARLLRVVGRAEVLDPTDPLWLPAAQALAASRLNSVHSPAELPDHWRHTGVQVVRIIAVGTAAERPGRYDQDDASAAPVPTDANTAGWSPWHAGGRRGQRWGQRGARRWGKRWAQSALGRRIRPRATRATPPPT